MKVLFDSNATIFEKEELRFVFPFLQRCWERGFEKATFVKVRRLKNIEPKLKFDEEREAFCLQRAGNVVGRFVNEIVLVSVLLPLEVLDSRSVVFDFERIGCKTKWLMQTRFRQR